MLEYISLYILIRFRIQNMIGLFFKSDKLIWYSYATQNKFLAEKRNYRKEK